MANLDESPRSRTHKVKCACSGCDATIQAAMGPKSYRVPRESGWRAGLVHAGVLHPARGGIHSEEKAAKFPVPGPFAVCPLHHNYDPFEQLRAFELAEYGFDSEEP